MSPILKRTLVGLSLSISSLLLAATPSDDRLPDAQWESRLPNEDPTAYYLYAGRLWAAGHRDDAVFWFYVGQLRFRFHLLASPDPDPSGGPALFGALQSQLGEPINLYAGADPDKMIGQINRVLKWDQDTPNGYTSKTEHEGEWNEVRAGLEKLRDYLDKNREELRKEREQQGIGEVGVVDGVYVEVRNALMPRDWPPLREHTSLLAITGPYEAKFEMLLGPIFFSGDSPKVIQATSFLVSVTEGGALTVIAMKGEAELDRRTFAVREEDGAVVYDAKLTGEEAGLSEGSQTCRTFLRVNTDDELVIQRDNLTEGRYADKGPVKLSYTFWNRAHRLKER